MHIPPFGVLCNVRVVRVILAKIVGYMNSEGCSFMCREGKGAKCIIELTLKHLNFHNHKQERQLCFASAV